MRDVRMHRRTQAEAYATGKTLPCWEASQNVRRLDKSKNENPLGGCLTDRSHGGTLPRFLPSVGM